MVSTALQNHPTYSSISVKKITSNQNPRIERRAERGRTRERRVPGEIIARRKGGASGRQDSLVRELLDLEKRGGLDAIFIILLKLPNLRGGFFDCRALVSDIFFTHFDSGN